MTEISEYDHEWGYCPECLDVPLEFEDGAHNNGTDIYNFRCPVCKLLVVWEDDTPFDFILPPYESE